MFAHDEYFPSPVPLWFVGSELLTKLFHAELNVVSRLLAENQDLPKLFDTPEATLDQRSACFALLAHRKLISMIDQTLVGRYEQSPSLGDVESLVLQRTSSLVPTDTPAWVLEMDRVVELLPQRTLQLLPAPLRRQGWDRNDDSAQLEAMRSLNTVERIQRFTEGVISQQFRRLASRWSITLAGTEPTHQLHRRKIRRTIDRQRIFRDKLIAEIDDVAETIPRFLQMMDDRKVKPQPTWTGWPGSWVEAYRNPRLRELIHKDKSRAIARARIHKK